MNQAGLNLAYADDSHRAVWFRLHPGREIAVASVANTSALPAAPSISMITPDGTATIIAVVYAQLVKAYAHWTE